MNDYSMEELLPVIAGRAQKYTSNESTSITYDKARQLMGSVLYCMEEDVSYNNANVNSEVFDAKQKMSAMEAFKLGLLRRKEKINRAKELYQDIHKSFCFYQNICYYDTIIKGMPAFFERYDVEFDARNHILTLDYPLIYRVQEQTGIDLIYEYLWRTQLEQRFLHKFSSTIIAEMLNEYHENIEELIINICRLVLRNAIGCVLLNKSVYELNFSNKERESLKTINDNKSLIELEKVLDTALDKIMREVFDKDEDLYNYLKQDLNEFAFEYSTCSDNNCLDKLFLGKEEEEVLQKKEFQDGDDMDNNALRNLIEEMSEIRLLSDKLILLKEHVRSLSDLKEILNECFFEGEYDQVFKLLSEEEAIILKGEISLKIEFGETLEGWEKYLCYN